MLRLEEVRQCYSVAGECDFVLVVHAASLEAYETWARDHLMANDAIRRYDTTVVWSCKKFETAVPLA